MPRYEEDWLSRLLPPRERRRLLFPDEWDLFSAFDIWCHLFVPGGPARRFRVEPLVLEDRVLTVLGPTSRLFCLPSEAPQPCAGRSLCGWSQSARAAA